jgi:hypothetical protein
MFSVEMLPAQHGDCILIEYGSAATPHRILVDTGTVGTFAALERRIGAMRNLGEIELLVLTHVDDDHLGGALTLLRQLDRLGVRFKDIWFNGFGHLQEGLLGGPDGEELTTLLETRALPWNQAFSGKAVVVPEDGDLPTFSIPGGMRIEVISPRREQLTALIPKWEAECRRAHLVPGGGVVLEPEEDDDDGLLGDEIDVPFLASRKPGADASASNASTIALVATYRGKSVLLAGDAHPDVLLGGLRRRRSSKPIDVLKVPHHGAKPNNPQQLIDGVGATKYLISSNGVKFKHPSREAVARILVHEGSKDIYFNYRSPINSVWENHAGSYDGVLHFGDGGSVVDLDG